MGRGHQLLLPILWPMGEETTTGGIGRSCDSPLLIRAAMSSVRKQTCTSSALQELKGHGNTRAPSQSLNQVRPQ